MRYTRRDQEDDSVLGRVWIVVVVVVNEGGNCDDIMHKKKSFPVTVCVFRHTRNVPPPPPPNESFVPTVGHTDESLFVQSRMNAFPVIHSFSVFYSSSRG